MAKRSGMVRRIAAEMDSVRSAVWDTAVQYTCDLFMLALNDPEVMGRDVFGEERIVRVMEAVRREHGEMIEALQNTAESDYWQERMDAGLRKIFRKRQFDRFDVRYPWIKKQQY